MTRKKNEMCENGRKRGILASIWLMIVVMLFTPMFSLAVSAVEIITIEESAVPLASSVLKPEATGKKTFTGGGATVDVSNANEGYVMIKFSGSNKKLKIRITRSGKTTYTYDLKSGGYEVFPLTSGDGSYTIEVFENVSGNQYAQALKCSVAVKLRDQKLPFLYPSQYVNFTGASNAVKKADSLVGSSKDGLAKVSGVYNFVISNVTYDTQKAKTVQSGYLPQVDAILKSGKGICFDYAALMTSMLRSQGIPTRLEIGYVSGGLYHAWISVYIKEVGWVNDVIQFDGKNWKLMDPTFASSGGSKYTGDGQNYKVQYIY